LFGARRGQIAGLVARELGTLLLAGAAIGLPLAGVGVARYLAPFSDRAPLAYGALAAALVIVAMMIAAAAARQAYVASRLRPAVALRS
jgi:ABC-type antimicrobial peptide transport system permease subunit